MQICAWTTHVQRMLVCFFVLLPSTVVVAEHKPQNILLIMADDLGWMDLRCQGNETLVTPHLDRLARQGMRFTDAYAAAPVCTPTRAAMMTGLSPARLAITNHAPGNGQNFCPQGKNLRSADWTTYLDLSYTTMAERLRDANYATAFVGKWHLSHRPGRDADGLRFEPQLRPEHQGFQINIGGCSHGGPPSYFEPYRIPALTPRRDGDYLPERLADECIDFLKSNRSQPFFLTWWNYSVHYPIQAPRDLIDKHTTAGRNKRPEYAAMIEGMDRAIGRVFKTLDQLDLTDSTLVIFTSDNGSLFENTPLRANKGHLYEGGIRVPMIVRQADVKAGSVCHTPVITTDVYATVLEAAGVEDESRTDSVSLRPLLEQKPPKVRSLCFHYPNYAFHKRNRLGSAIRRGDYKLIHFYDNDSVELYNVRTDISESQNLSDRPAHKARRDDLSARLKAWLSAAGAKMPTPVKP